MIKKIFVIIVTIICCCNAYCQNNSAFFNALDYNIQYTGRIDYSNPQKPRIWQPGVYITASFKGTYCNAIIDDEVLWGKNHNYLEVVVDGIAKRIQTTSAHNIISLAKNLKDTVHTILICKNTEANIGYIDFIGLQCEQLVKPSFIPTRKIECYGNSITCGTGSDQSEIPCGKGVWQDQHNAYMSYGASAARLLNAQWQLSSVSGIGLTRSCCNMNIILPQVYDKVDMRDDSIRWNFENYVPDVVTICLGQNDGMQDSSIFCSMYVKFIDTLRKHYPNANIICLNSPMADSSLNFVLKKYITSVVNFENEKNDKKVSSFFFSKRYFHGCDSHPSLAEHQQMAVELSAYIKQLINW